MAKLPDRIATRCANCGKQLDPKLGFCTHCMPLSRQMICMGDNSVVDGEVNEKYVELFMQKLGMSREEAIELLLSSAKDHSEPLTPAVIARKIWKLLGIKPRAGKRTGPA